MGTKRLSSVTKFARITLSISGVEATYHVGEFPSENTFPGEGARSGSSYCCGSSECDIAYAIKATGSVRECSASRQGNTEFVQVQLAYHPVVDNVRLHGCGGAQEGFGGNDVLPAMATLVTSKNDLPSAFLINSTAFAAMSV